MALNKSNYVVRPWQGESYGPKSPLGIAVMLVGESAYDWPQRKREGISAKEVTRKIIRDEICGKHKHRFQGRAAEACAGDSLRDKREERELFWNSVIFYNYVQALLPNRKRRPSKEQWKAAAPAFLKMIDDANPQLIIVFGRGVWDNFFDTSLGKSERSGRTQKDWSRLVRTRKGSSALAIRIDHPASFTFHPSTQWTPKINAELRKLGKRPIGKSLQLVTGKKG